MSFQIQRKVFHNILKVGNFFGVTVTRSRNAGKERLGENILRILVP